MDERVLAQNTFPLLYGPSHGQLQRGLDQASTQSRFSAALLTNGSWSFFQYRFRLMPERQQTEPCMTIPVGSSPTKQHV